MIQQSLIIYQLVAKELKELFQHIRRYTPQNIELDLKLKPFIPEYIPAIGDTDAFIKDSITYSLCILCREEFRLGGELFVIRIWLGRLWVNGLFSLMRMFHNCGCEPFCQICQKFSYSQFCAILYATYHIAGFVFDKKLSLLKIWKLFILVF